MLNLERKVGQAVVIGDLVRLTLLAIDPIEDLVTVQLEIDGGCLQKLTMVVGCHDTMMLDDIEIDFTRKGRARVDVGIGAPSAIRVYRDEVYNRIQEEKQRDGWAVIMGEDHNALGLSIEDDK